MEEHAMDSIYYFEKSGMEYNLLMHHPFFTLTEIKLATAMMMDAYDVQNLKWTRQFLFDSLSMKHQPHIVKYTDSNINKPMLRINIQ